MLRHSTALVKKYQQLHDDFELWLSDTESLMNELSTSKLDPLEMTEQLERAKVSALKLNFVPFTRNHTAL